MWFFLYKNVAFWKLPHIEKHFDGLGDQQFPKTKMEIKCFV